MIMTRSRNSSRAGSPVRGGGGGSAPVRGGGGAPVRGGGGGAPVRGGGGAPPVRRDDDDSSRSPSPIRHKSRIGRRQTPSATAAAAAAKSDSSPRGRTMTRSASRAASRGGSPKAAADTVKIVADAAAAHYQPLDANYPDRVRCSKQSDRH